MKSITFNTAQNVQISYELASSMQRMVASIIDAFAFFIYFLIMSFIFSASLLTLEIDSFLVLKLFLIRLPWVFYSPIVEFFTAGQSLGKVTMGLRVVQINGENAQIKSYFIRWVFRVIDIWLGFGFLAILFSSISSQGQRIGDKLAGTIVIRTKNSVLFNLNEILNIKDSTNHVVTYKNVVVLTDEDAMLIKKTLLKLNKNANEETKKVAISLINKLKEILHLEKIPDKKLEFLSTVLKDYIVLTRS